MFLIMWHFYLLSVHGSSLDDFQQALTAPQAQLERVEIIYGTWYCYYGIPMLNRTGTVHRLNYCGLG